MPSFPRLFLSGLCHYNPTGFFFSLYLSRFTFYAVATHGRINNLADAASLSRSIDLWGFLEASAPVAVSSFSPNLSSTNKWIKWVVCLLCVESAEGLQLSLSLSRIEVKPKFRRKIKSMNVLRILGRFPDVLFTLSPNKLKLKISYDTSSTSRCCWLNREIFHLTKALSDSIKL